MALFMHSEDTLNKANGMCIQNFKFLEAFTDHQSEDVEGARCHIESVVQTVFDAEGLPEQIFHLRLFGSCCYGMSTPNSDIDVVCIYSNPKLGKQNFLKKFHLKLKAAGVAHRISDCIQHKITVSFHYRKTSVDFTCARECKYHVPLQVSQGLIFLRVVKSFLL